MTFRAKGLLILGVSVVGVVLDQVTKVTARGILEGQPPFVTLWGILTFRWVENPGAFLSLGASLSPAVRTALFTVLVAIVLGMLVVSTLARSDATRGEAWAVALVVAGGIGNLIDRVLYGRVRDFANLKVGPLSTGVFNVADMAITAGGVVLLLVLIAGWRRKEPRS